MTEPARFLTLQFLEWVADRPRTYADVMETWRTSCPRLSIWEDATSDKLVEFDRGGSGTVVLTPQGRAMLEAASSSRASPDRPAAEGSDRR
ncbi:MAG: hypothetical protein HY246_01100 [Proteobacteria bacterium]|nr:hypothetical protein [Pseudomonadota bacterium]